MSVTGSVTPVILEPEVLAEVPEGSDQVLSQGAEVRDLFSGDFMAPGQERYLLVLHVCKLLQVHL